MAQCLEHKKTNSIHCRYVAENSIFHKKLRSFQPTLGLFYAAFVYYLRDTHRYWTLVRFAQNQKLKEYDKIIDKWNKMYQKETEWT